MIKDLLRDKPAEVTVEEDRSDKERTGFFPSPSEAIKQPTQVRPKKIIICFSGTARASPSTPPHQKFLLHFQYSH